MAAKVGSIIAELAVDDKKFTNALVRAGVKVKGFETDSNRSFQRAERGITGSFGKMSSAGQGFSASLTAAAAALKGGFVGALAGLGLSEIIGQVKQVARSVAEVGDQAKIAGVDVESFQELKFVAEQNRIGVDALADGLKELSLRADEFILTGAGSSAEAFQRLGYDAETLKEKLKEPSELFAEIIGRLQKFDEAARIRIADEVFGGAGGEKFVQLIDQGERGIRETIETARSLGLVMDEAIIAKAAEVDRQFNVVASTVGTALKGAIVDAAAALSSFIGSFRSFEEQTSTNLQAKQVEIAQKRLDLENEILALQGQQREENAALSSVAQSLGFAGTSSNGIGQQIAERQKQLEQLQRQDAEITNVLNARLPTTPTASASFIPPVITPTAPKSASGGSSQNDYQRQVEQIKQATDALRMENEALAQVSATTGNYEAAQAKARAEADLLVAAQKAGLEVTPELRARISDLASAYATAETESRRLAQSQEDAAQAAEDFRDGAKDITRGFIDDLRAGRSAAEALEYALDKIIDKLLDAALDGLFAAPTTGGGGNIFGNILGAIGSFLSLDGGGWTGPGAKDEPKGVVHGGEFVLTKRATERAGVGNLYALMNYLEAGTPGFASGGYVGTATFLPCRRHPHRTPGHGPQPAGASRCLRNVASTSNSAGHAPLTGNSAPLLKKSPGSNRRRSCNPVLLNTTKPFRAKSPTPWKGRADPMLSFSLASLRDMPLGPSLQEKASGSSSGECLVARFLVPVAEIEGAAIGYSFRDLERLRDMVGPEWLATVFAGLDQKDPTIIRSMSELGIRGAAADIALETLGLDKLAAYIAAALLLRLKR